MTGASVEQLPAAPGTYALVLEGRAHADVTVGRWGSLQLQPGYYVYVGSAFGPGGLRARVGRHLRGAGAKHWHIDYLRDWLQPFAVWYSDADRRLEHEWAGVLAGLDALTAVPGIGTSDCPCRAHLFRSAGTPDLGLLSARVLYR